MQAGNAKDEYVMTNLLKWLEEKVPADRARLDALNAARLLPALQQARGAERVSLWYADVLAVLVYSPQGITKMQCVGRDAPPRIGSLRCGATAFANRV